MEAILIGLVLFAVAALFYFAVVHRDTFEELLKRDIIEVREEAKKTEDKVRGKLRKFDDKVREDVSQKIKKIRARRK
jgi:uncharacterized protein YxeA